MQNIFQELKRRNVFRVGFAYVIAGWTLAQVAELALDSFDAPVWIIQTVLVGLAIGLPVALVLAWAFELTSEGIKREEDVDRSRPPDMAAHRTLDFVIIGLLVVAVAYFVVDKYMLSDEVLVKGSLAVLPFTNRSADDDAHYFVDGVHDDLLTQLARRGDIRVISRTSVLEYRDTTKNMRQIGLELGVATLLEGAVQRMGDRVRITAQLIDARTDEHLWAATYDRELSPSSIFAIQTEIAATIAGELSITLGAAQSGSAIDQVPTHSQAAYDLYQRARSIPYDDPVDRLWTAVDLAKQAVELDPDFALAMGVIADNYINIYWFTTQQPEHRDAARHWIERALAIAPEDPQLQLTLSTILYEGYLDYDAALAAVDKAQLGLPGDSAIYLNRAVILRRRGDIQDAIEAFEKAQLMDPRDVFSLVHALWSYTAIGDVAGASAIVDRVRALPHASTVHLGYANLVDLYLLGDTASMRALLRDMPDADLASENYLRVMVPLLERRYDDALAALETLPDPISVQFNLWTHSFVRARILHAQGRVDEARTEAALAVTEFDRIATTMPRNARPVVARALMQAILGNEEEARDDARRAVELYPVELDVVDGPSYIADGLRALAVFAETDEVAAHLQDYLALPAKAYYVDYLLLDPVFDRHRDHPSIRSLQAKYSLRSSEP
jgi:TolB-like protein/Flp pilus assembly protein TadD